MAFLLLDSFPTDNMTTTCVVNRCMTHKNHTLFLWLNSPATHTCLLPVTSSCFYSFMHVHDLFVWISLFPSVSIACLCAILHREVSFIAWHGRFQLRHVPACIVDLTLPFVMTYLQPRAWNVARQRRIPSNIVASFETLPYLYA